MKFKDGYRKSLSGSDLIRYDTVVKLCDGIDPYEVDLLSTSNSVDLLPSLNIVHILQYLVHTTKSHSMQQKISYKGTDAHKFATSGWMSICLFCQLDLTKFCVFVKSSIRLVFLQAVCGLGALLRSVGTFWQHGVIV